jgi:hypothetical protein
MLTILGCNVGAGEGADRNAPIMVLIAVQLTGDLLAQH